MVSNYYMLRLLAADLDTNLRGSNILEVFCQSKNELLIVCRSGREDRCLTISCEPSMNFIFLRGEMHRAKKNSIDVFRILWGRIIRQVSILPADRELVLHCSGDVRLLIRLYGSKANVLLVDDRNTVIDSFLNPKEYRGATLSESGNVRSQRAWDMGEFHAQLRAIGTILVPAAVKKLLPLFNTTLIRELCFRARLREHQVVAELTDDDIHRLHAASQSLLKELEESPKARIYYQDGLPMVISLLPLAYLHDVQAESFDSVHEAIRVFIGKSRRQKSLLQEKESLLHFLRQGAERSERTLQRMEQETEALQRAMQYEFFGKLLMAHLNDIQKGMQEVQVEDVFSHDRARVVIRLDQKLTPAQNAEHYFNKSKKARAGIEEKLDHQEEVRERWETLRELLDRVSDLQTQDQLMEFTTAYREQLKRLGYKGTTGGTRDSRAEVPFRTFTVTGGFQVWVGKSSENNDLLTLKYAKPSDLWFHTRGSSGSHVILRMGTGKGEPGKRAIEEAASIAAFYSKMKTAKHVPVAMTERKYVRKPRGTSAGTVVIEREKLLFVNPKLPSTADQASKE